MLAGLPSAMAVGVFDRLIAFLLFTGFWNDVNCGLKNAFICERHNSTYSGFVPTVLPPLGGCPEMWILFQNKVHIHNK